MGSVPTMANTVFNGGNNSGGIHPAYIATANTIFDPNWYMDSGASNHITNDSGNLEWISNSYGKTEILVGNGNKKFVTLALHTYLAKIKI